MATGNGPPGIIAASIDQIWRNLPGGMIDFEDETPVDEAHDNDWANPNTSDVEVTDTDEDGASKPL